MSLMEGEDGDHKVVPYRDRQYDLKRKHLMNGSTTWNLQKKKLALRFISLITLMMSSLSSRLNVSM